MQKPFNCISIGHELLTVYCFTVFFFCFLFTINIRTTIHTHTSTHLWELEKKVKRATFACNKLIGKSHSATCCWWKAMPLLFTYFIHTRTHKHSCIYVDRWLVEPECILFVGNGKQKKCYTQYMLLKKLLYILPLCFYMR